MSLRIIKLIESLSHKMSADIIGKQLVRSATSVGANYRAACGAKSTADLINKLSIIEEANESLYWLELLEESNLMSSTKLVELKKDMNEVVAMIVSSIKTLRSKQIQNLKSL